MMTDIVRAADLALIAERARADALRGGSVSDIVRLEGAADRAVRRLGIKADKPAEQLEAAVET
jgi:hypothetical protein